MKTLRMHASRVLEQARVRGRPIRVRARTVGVTMCERVGFIPRCVNGSSISRPIGPPPSGAWWVFVFRNLGFAHAHPRLITDACFAGSNAVQRDLSRGLLVLIRGCVRTPIGSRRLGDKNSP
jgi:hypothetical protein